VCYTPFISLESEGPITPPNAELPCYRPSTCAIDLKNHSKVESRSGDDGVPREPAVALESGRRNKRYLLSAE
jgi:hypothetical protein